MKSVTMNKLNKKSGPLKKLAFVRVEQFLLQKAPTKKEQTEIHFQ